MAFDCPSDNCGYRTSEIKGAGAVPPQGKLLRLSVPARAGDSDERWAADMTRDVVKSNTAGVRIPELDLEVTPGSLGGMYTTVEGLLALVKDTLFDGQASELASGPGRDAPSAPAASQVRRALHSAASSTNGSRATPSGSTSATRPSGMEIVSTGRRRAVLKRDLSTAEVRRRWSQAP